jgi:hypothetical protein
MFVCHVYYILDSSRITRLILGDEPLISEVVMSQRTPFNYGKVADL